MVEPIVFLIVSQQNLFQLFQMFSSFGVKIVWNILFCSLVMVYYVVGRGFSINFPVSSHDILKSLRTWRVLDVSICGAITNLCMPITNRNTAIGEDDRKIKIKRNCCSRSRLCQTMGIHSHNNNAAMTKTKWFISDSASGTTAVFGSVSQYQAPTDVMIDMVASKTVE